MKAIGSGGLLSTWVTPSVILGQIAAQGSADWFLINESAAAQTVTLNSQTITIPAASMQEMTGETPIAETDIVPEVSAISDTVQYQPDIPQVSVSPSPVYTGEQVTLSGSSFADQGPNSRIILMQNGVDYGAPGDDYKVAVTAWSPDTIEFTMPNGASGPPLNMGSATIQVETNNNVISATSNITVSSVPSLTISQISPASASPGESVTVTGGDFGSSQGQGYVLLSQNGVNYGGPGDSYGVNISQWSNQSISFTIPDGTSGPALSSGTASVQIVSDQGL
jgi:hypothetical protein